MNDGRHPYKRMVPKVYHHVAGLDRYAPQIRDLGRGTYDCLVRIGSPARKIDESAFCTFKYDRSTVSVLVAKVESPALFESIVHLSEAVLTGVRLHRFTTAYKAYESLVPNTDIQLAAIRHAISHPETVLSRPKTVAALQQLFGGTKIDLNKAAHRTVYYRELGRLLISVDNLIGDSLRSGIFQWRRIPPGFRPAPLAFAHHYGAVRSNST